jgi:hypothetical protein
MPLPAMLSGRSTCPHGLHQRGRVSVARSSITSVSYCAIFKCVGEKASLVLHPEHIVAIAGGLVLGICKENIVWFLFL